MTRPTRLRALRGATLPLRGRDKVGHASAPVFFAAPGTPSSCLAPTKKVRGWSAEKRIRRSVAAHLFGTRGGRLSALHPPSPLTGYGGFLCGVLVRLPGPHFRARTGLCAHDPGGSRRLSSVPVQPFKAAGRSAGGRMSRGLPGAGLRSLRAGAAQPRPVARSGPARVHPARISTPTLAAAPPQARL